MSDHPVVDNLSPDRTGLVVVDAQNAFAGPESPIADRGVDLTDAIETVPNVVALVETARDHDLPVFYTRSVRRGDNRDGPERQHRILPKIYRDGEAICCAGNPDTGFVDGVEPAEDEYAVEKRRYDAFHGTHLESYMRVEGVETALFCGFTTNVCVEGTARGGHERGFDVVVVEDCCAAFSEAEHEAALHNVELALGTTATTEEVRSLLAAG